MHENNFEKQVREKMDDLGFDPSDAVWAAVDKEINKEKNDAGPCSGFSFFRVWCWLEEDFISLLLIIIQIK